MKNVFMVLAIGALVLGSILTVGIMMEQDKPEPNVVYYNVPAPAPAPTRTTIIQRDSAPTMSSGYAVIKVNKPVSREEMQAMQRS
jgi:hypothetical protein